MTTGEQLVSFAAALAGVLLWVGRMVWTVARKLSAIEARLDAQALEQRSLQDQLNAQRHAHREQLAALQVRAEANRGLYEQLTSDVLRQAAEQSHRVELLVVRLEAVESRTREELTRLSSRARAHSTKIEAVRLPGLPPLPKPPKK